MENIEKPKVEAETVIVTNEHEKLEVKVRMQKEHFETTKAYSEMTGVEHGKLLEEILNSGVKNIRSHLSNLPHTSMRKILRWYGAPESVINQLTPATPEN